MSSKEKVFRLTQRQLKSLGFIKLGGNLGSGDNTPACVAPEGYWSAEFLGKRNITLNMLIPAKPGRRASHQQHSVLVIEQFSLQGLAESGM